MVHARVLRPPSYGARLRALDSAAAAGMPGVLKVVRDGSFVALLAEREYQAVTAARALANGAQWDERASLPESKEIYQKIGRCRRDSVIHDSGKSGTGAAMKASTGAHTSHASMARPAPWRSRDEALTVWTHSQGVHPLRGR
jgi:CO/xanthine dehydrogenase Mo-binding subunit